MPTKKSILIIEDDRILQELYFECFAAAGLVVFQAYDGIEGLSILEQHPEIALVLVDIMLPRLSGYDVIKRIRADEISGEVPIVAASALTDQEDRERGLTAGASEYIGKGEKSPAELVELIRGYVIPEDQAISIKK